MSDFILWNIIFGIAWMLWTIIRWKLPKSTVVVVVSRGRSTAMHGDHAVLLVNDKTHRVIRNGPLWRHQTTGHVLPASWAEKLDANSPDVG